MFLRGSHYDSLLQDNQQGPIFDIEQAGQIEEEKLKIFKIIKEGHSGKKQLKEINEQKPPEILKCANKQMQEAIFNSLKLENINNRRAKERKRHQAELAKAIANSLLEK